MVWFHKVMLRRLADKAGHDWGRVHIFTLSPAMSSRYQYACTMPPVHPEPMIIILFLPIEHWTRGLRVEIALVALLERNLPLAIGVKQVDHVHTQLRSLRDTVSESFSSRQGA